MSTELKPNRRKGECPFYLCTTDYFPPNHSQMSTAVKGRDVLHDERLKRRAFWRREMRYAICVLAILVLTFAAMFIIASVVVK